MFDYLDFNKKNGLFYHKEELVLTTIVSQEVIETISVYMVFHRDIREKVT